MKKRNFIACIILLMSIIYPNYVFAQKAITEFFPIYNYHENSANNGTGDFRQIKATSFIGNVTHYMALSSGGETVPITWPAYDEDTLVLSPSLNNTRAFANGEELVKYEFLVYLSPNLKIDFSKQVQLNVGKAQNTNINWSDLNYSYNQEKGLLSYEIPANFKNLITSQTTGSIGIQFRVTFKSSTEEGQKDLIPINLKTVATTNKAQYVSGATSNYQIDFPSEAKKEVENLETDRTDNEYRPGDRIKYSISYLNNMFASQTKIANLQLEDKIPEGFLLDANTFKMMMTDRNGVTEDVTSSGNVEIISTDGTIQIVTHNLDPANKISIIYEGQIDPNTHLDQINNIANFTADDTSTGQKIHSSAEVALDIVNTNAAPVTVKYEDEIGNELASSDVLQGKIGANYQAVAKNITGWTVKTTPGNITGVFTNQPQEVVYIYQKNETVAAPVTVKYLDEAGNELMPSDVLNGQIGAAYQTTAKNITGWTVKTTSNNTMGTFTDAPQEVIYIYQKEQQHTINPPVDENNKDVPPSKDENNKVAPPSNDSKGKSIDKLPATGEVLGNYSFSGMLILLFGLLVLMRQVNVNKK